LIREGLLITGIKLYHNIMIVSGWVITTDASLLHTIPIVKYNLKVKLFNVPALTSELILYMILLSKLKVNQLVHSEYDVTLEVQSSSDKYFTCKQ